jgi:CxxC-x17-CxxC domain-containing protein
MKESRTCQNCKTDFSVASEDFDFYAKLSVPAPLTCPRCRFERRLMFRNERNLYKRNCDKCGKGIITIFSPEGAQPVYCSPCWWGDSWDARDYGVDYDPSRPFFEQLRELRDRVPCMALIVGYASLVRSEYVNHAGACKDCYLIFNADFCENVLYSSTITHVKESMDLLMSGNSELTYDSIDSYGTKVFFSENAASCIETYFSKDCAGCLNCIGCVGLRNKSYHIFNKPVSREEFTQFVADARLDTRAGVAAMEKAAHAFWLTVPRRANYGTRNVNSTGDYIYDCKNAKECYQAVGLEDGAYCQLLTLAPTRDAYDLTEWGMNSERIVDAITVGENCANIKYCSGAWANCSNVEYSMYAVGSSDCFGCVNLRKQKYCILNKQYTKEEYEKLRAEIIKDMMEHPYMDAQGRTFPYGEFLPYDLSFFAYNESHANQYWPKTEAEIGERGFRFKAPEKSAHVPTLGWDAVPESIRDVTDGITKEILGCASCGKSYRIVPAELALLRRFDLPVPTACPDCRHMRRVARVNPPVLYARECNKCKKGIVTAYAPERPEIVYCESCYQQEVI